MQVKQVLALNHPTVLRKKNGFLYKKWRHDGEKLTAAQTVIKEIQKTA
jgi:hypothetical protein